MVVVVALVGVQLRRTPTARAAPGADRRDAPHQRYQDLAVVQVGAGDAQRQGQTGALGDEVDLRALLAPIYRIRTRQLPPFSARMFTESIAQRDQSSSP
jgi:hypothetical protein